MNKIDLNNRVAIITGGAQGFGFSMVDRFSESGATVITVSYTHLTLPTKA